MVGMVVLEALETDEGRAQHHGDPHPADGLGPMAGNQCMVSDGQGQT